jgi:hypothetical protein
MQQILYLVEPLQLLLGLWPAVDADDLGRVAVLGSI